MKNDSEGPADQAWQAPAGQTLIRCKVPPGRRNLLRHAAAFELADDALDDAGDFFRVDALTDRAPADRFAGESFSG
jgi:hypothetical protein